MKFSEESPVVSVIMAVRDVHEYLALAIESILGQSFGDLEFIIVEDGATEETAAIVDAYASRDGRIRVFKERACGLTRCLNVGIRAARGEFIARMDADDVSWRDRFERQLSYLRAHPEIIALGSRARYINASGTPMFVRVMPETDEEISSCHLTDWGGFIIHPSAMIRADAIRKIGGYDEFFLKAQDYDLWFRLAKIGKLANLADVLIDYRYHGKAITQGGALEQTKFRKIILEREMKARGMVCVNELDRRYVVMPRDPYWMLPAAAASGYLRMVLWSAVRVLRHSCVSILRVFPVVGKAMCHAIVRSLGGQ
jgi:glycosyltransferase involved in cell wall biosynthesis